MKNFQQTPKQRRVAMAQAKSNMARREVFQPKEAWGSHRKVGGAHLDLLECKQMAAGHPGMSGFHGWW